MANAVINPGTVIQDGVIINTSASIDHDCLIKLMPIFLQTALYLAMFVLENFLI